MKAGVDFGLTNVKAYWLNSEDHEFFHSTAERSRDDLAEIMRLNGVTELHVTGNGPRDGFEGFRIVGPHPKDDPLFSELATQARGAVELITGSGAKWTSVRRMFVSIGTGTSYLFENTNDEIYLNPIGNALGAGALDGHKSLFGYGSGAPLDDILGGALPPESFDLTVGEAIPALKNDKRAAYTASHFVKAARLPANIEHEGYDRKWIASAMYELLVAVTRDLMIYEDNPKYAGAKDVVILGALPHKSRIFRTLLSMYLGSIGKNPIFPPHGEFAGAVGAWHRHE